MDDDTIDKSEFMPLKALNDRFEFLRLKGIAVFNRGKILKSKHSKFVIDRLAEDEIARYDRNPVLSQEQAYAGNSFKTLCDCAAGRTSAFGINEGEPIQRDAILHKIAIEAQLTADHRHVIRRLIIYSSSNPLSEEEFKAIRDRITLHIREAFDALIEAMKPENVQMKLDAHKQEIPPELKKRLDLTRNRQ